MWRWLQFQRHVNPQTSLDVLCTLSGWSYPETRSGVPTSVKKRLARQVQPCNPWPADDIASITARSFALGSSELSTPALRQISNASVAILANFDRPTITRDSGDLHNIQLCNSVEFPVQLSYEAEKLVAVLVAVRVRGSFYYSSYSNDHFPLRANPQPRKRARKTSMVLRKAGKAESSSLNSRTRLPHARTIGGLALAGALFVSSSDTLVSLSCKASYRTRDYLHHPRPAIAVFRYTKCLIVSSSLFSMQNTLSICRWESSFAFLQPTKTHLRDLKSVSILNVRRWIPQCFCRFCASPQSQFRKRCRLHVAFVLCPGIRHRLARGTKTGGTSQSQHPLSLFRLTRISSTTCSQRERNPTV
jgi:hypothetical protein